jgi:hypothetical protein
VPPSVSHLPARNLIFAPKQDLLAAARWWDAVTRVWTLIPVSFGIQISPSRLVAAGNAPVCADALHPLRSRAPRRGFAAAMRSLAPLTHVRYRTISEPVTNSEHRKVVAYNTFGDDR